MLFDSCSAIKRIGSLQRKLSKPSITGYNLTTQVTTDTLVTIQVHLSEPMQQTDTVEVFRSIQENGKNILVDLRLTAKDNSLEWHDNGTKLQFRMPLVKGV